MALSKYFESSKYAKKQPSDQSRVQTSERGYITDSKHAVWVEPNEELKPNDEPSSKRWNNQDTMLAFVIVVPVVLVTFLFTKPLWQGAPAPLNAVSQTLLSHNPADRPTVNAATANSSVVTAGKIAPSSGSEPLTNAIEIIAGREPAAVPKRLRRTR